MGGCIVVCFFLIFWVEVGEFSPTARADVTEGHIDTCVVNNA